MEPNKTVHRLNTVDNAMSLLTLFLKKDSFGLIDIEEELQISKTAAFRLAATLTDRGFLVKNNAEKTYQPGPILFQIVNKFQQNDIAAISKPYMNELSKLTGESVYLSIQTGNKFLFIEGIESHQPLKVTSPLGAENDLYYGAAGKIHMAYMSSKNLETYFKRTYFEKYTHNTPTNKEQLLESLDIVRAQGYSISIGERMSELGGVAAPIWGDDDEPIAALAILLPLSRFTDEKRLACIESVCSYAEKISDELTKHHH